MDSDDTIHKQSFSIDDLATRSVTIYPTRAAVVRDIENVVIKPGRNEITLHNLTPEADEHSIKVEGHGTSALVTDMTVDLVPNFRFDLTSDSDSEDESDDELKNPELEQLTQDINILHRQLDDANESRSSATKQLSYLDQLTNTLTQPLPVVGPVTTVLLMSENLDTYSIYREKVYSVFREAQAVCVKLTEKLDEKLKKQLKVQTAWDKTMQKANKIKEQHSRQRAHERLERQEEKLEVPRFVYRIRITIESGSLPSNTPAVTASVNTGKPAKEGDDEPPSGSKGPSLRISYITAGASWTPRYDLRLDTISSTAILTYRAHFFNRTGEVWRNARLTLSTSQTSFGGLEDKVPWMDSWRVALCKRGTYVEKDGSLYSRREKELKDEKLRKRKEETNLERGVKPIAEAHLTAAMKSVHGFNRISGLSAPSPATGLSSTWSCERPPQPSYYVAPHPPSAMVRFSQDQDGVEDQQVQNWGGYGAVNQMESQTTSPPGRSMMSMTSDSYSGGAKSGGPSVLGSYRARARAQSANLDSGPYDSDPDDDEDDDATLNPPQRMGLATSSPESYGLTTTYDLPGLRTIPPSKLLRRHVISEINLPHVELSHISVPKLRAAAFLKARIRNPSKTPLLSGPAGLTLDGSFLGNATIPRCAPDEHFELGLGVDEEVMIEYRKPVHKSAMQGVLVKEHVVAHERCVRIHNARGNLVKIVLFDQVPLSEDDRLRIAISRPRGLKFVGDLAKVAGTGADFMNTGVAVGNPGGAMGYVQAELRKGGEIRWEVSVEGGQDAVLPLEYEARFPGGDMVYRL